MPTIGTEAVIILKPNVNRARALLKAAAGSTIYVSRNKEQLDREPTTGYLLSTTTAEEFRTKEALYAIGGDAARTLYVWEE